jgi:hypothetical protein
MPSMSEAAKAAHDRAVTEGVLTYLDPDTGSWCSQRELSLLVVTAAETAVATARSGT